MNFIAWIIFGALAGWVASKIAGTSERQGCILDIVIGIVGAFIGGMIVQSLTNQPFQVGFNPQSFIVAVLGAVLLLALVKFVRRS
ncbi:MAG: GlsB/YeaQ/YmgE family stress response membrane protein [Chloroflexaceae bacterium]